jgi:hypothetical protein
MVMAMDMRLSADGGKVQDRDRIREPTVPQVEQTPYPNSFEQLQKSTKVYMVSPQFLAVFSHF